MYIAATPVLVPAFQKPAPSTLNTDGNFSPETVEENISKSFQTDGTGDLNMKNENKSRPSTLRLKKGVLCEATNVLTPHYQKNLPNYSPASRIAVLRQATAKKAQNMSTLLKNMKEKQEFGQIGNGTSLVAAEKTPLVGQQITNRGEILSKLKGADPPGRAIVF